MKSELAQVKEVYGKTLVEAGDRNKDIFVVEADLMKASGSAPFKEKYPDRHINVGVAEQNLVGVAAGIAAAGRVPFACTMANFMAKRACDQVAMSVAYNKFNVKLVGCYAGLTQEKNGGTHVSFIDLAVMRALPNMKVVAPADCVEFAQAVMAVSQDVAPTYLRMAKLLPESILGKDYQFEIGKAHKIGKGKDLTLVSTGLATCIALEALPELARENIDARLVHLPTLKPVDREIIVNSAKDTGAIITIEDHSIHGGLGGLVAEIVTCDCPVLVGRLGLNDTFGLTASLGFQLEYFGLTVENIISTAKQMIKNK